MNQYRKRNLILSILIGLLFVYLLKISQLGYEYIPFIKLEDIKSEISNKVKEVDRLKLKKEELQSKYVDLTVYSSQDDGIQKLLETELTEYKMLSGTTPVYGPGVTIIVSDANKGDNYENPNDALVHDIDIITLISDLKNAGAEAIAVNGQRIVFNVTRVVCTGPTMKINDRVYSQPFIIEAIGNKQHLAAAINAPNSYGDILKKWGLFVEINTNVYLELPGYYGNLDFKYMKQKE